MVDPTAQSRPVFDDIAQYYTAKGIAVFLPNVRGSTGFGHHYVALDDRENRLNSIRDLVDMLAHLDQDGRVNVKRAGIAGWFLWGVCGQCCVGELTLDTLLQVLLYTG